MIEYIEYFEKASGLDIEALQVIAWLPIDKGYVMDGWGFRGDKSIMSTTAGFYNAINELSRFYFKKDIDKLSIDDKIVIESLPINHQNSNFSLNDQLLQMLDLYKWSLNYNYPIIFDY